MSMSNEILSCFVFVEITLYIKKGDWSYVKI